MPLMPATAFFSASMREGCFCVTSLPVTSSRFSCKATVRRAESWAVGVGLAAPLHAVATGPSAARWTAGPTTKSQAMGRPSPEGGPCRVH